MHTLLIADRRRPDLAPLTERTAPVLLPVAGKPLIDHQLEALATAGLNRVTLAISPFAAEVEARVGDGAPWGLEVDFIVTRGDEPVDDIVSRLDCAGEELVIVSALRLRDQCARDFLRRAARSSDAAVVTAVSGNTPLGIELRRPGRAGGKRTIDVPGVRSVALTTLDDYLGMNRAAVCSQLALFVDARELSPGVRIGRRARLSLDSVKSEGVFVGDRTRVDPKAVLRQGVVLSHDVLVDRGAELESVVVLPGSYVGEGVHLRSAIVWENLVLRLTDRQPSYVEDPTVVAPLGLRAARRRVANCVGRGTALLVLALSAPLWPLMLLSSLFADSVRPLRTKRVAGNRLVRRGEAWIRRPVTVRRAAVPIPWLRNLPLILAVLSGDLQWVGVRPSDPSEEAVDPEHLPLAGLIGPAQLELHPCASETERRLADAFLRADRRPWRALRWLWRAAGAFFTRPAWIAPPLQAAEQFAESGPEISSNEVAA